MLYDLKKSFKKVNKDVYLYTYAKYNTKVFKYSSSTQVKMAISRIIYWQKVLVFYEMFSFSTDV